ncbi:MAG: DUF2484 family protein [Rhodobacteraceae bacterium]|nr:DUF2484 family protein [Paracoccaceae bacterium]
MSAPLLAACLWVLAATVTAMLPYRRQFPPGIVLLLTAPLILVWIGVQHGALWALIGLAGFVSMFRRPFWYLGRRALGLPAARPGERDGR